MKKGILTLSTIAAITVLCWIISSPVVETNPARQFGELLGALALTGFACAIFISTRYRLLDKLFNGLDKAYIVHKWLGISSILLVFFHHIIIHGSSMASDHSPDGANELGIRSYLLFLVLILIALLAKKMNYQKWKAIHRFIAVPFVIGLIHYYSASSYGAFGLSPLSLWMDIISIIGLLSAVYSVFLYEWLGFPFKYEVSGVRTVSKGIVEITGTPVGKHIAYRPGQFAFVKFTRLRSKFPSHPITISQAPQDGQIQFTIKGLGDHTCALIRSVQLSDRFSVSQPHGEFDYTKAGRQQIWIAGGIGITPFRSFYQSKIPAGFSIDFFYAYHGEKEGSYLDEIKALNLPMLRVHPIDDTQDGFLTAEKIRDRVGTETPVDVFFCGPKPMRDSLRKGLRASKLPVAGLHFEEFQFGR